MKVKKFYITNFLCFCLILSLAFLPYLFDKKQQNSYAYSSVSIEECDDYIDYFRGNINNDINKYIVMLYDALYDNFNLMKNGSFEISLKDYDNYNGFVSLSTQEKYRSLAGAINAIKYDVPEIFFVDFTAVNLERSYGIGYYVITSDNCYIDGISSSTQLNTMLNKLEQSREEIYSQMDMNWTDYEKVLFVNNYLVENVEYDLSLSKNFVHTVYGSIVNNVAVCDGYSYGGQYLLDGLGIKNLVCAGYAYNPSTGSSEGHMWSYVNLYDHWYGLDITWNDPIVYGNYPQSFLESLKTTYFLKGWNAETNRGFYLMDEDQDERVVQNYELYFQLNDETYIIYELPCPEIEVNDYADPVFNVSQNNVSEGESNSSSTISLSATNMLENMHFAYKYSSDGGLSFGDFVSCENSITFDLPTQNGVYKFYIITDDGKIVKEFENVFTVEVGTKYNLQINVPDGVEFVVSPQKESYYAGDSISISFTKLPEGKEIDQVSSQQAEISNQDNVYYFNFPNNDIQIDVSLKDKLYQISVINVDGIVYEIDKTQAIFNEEVTIKILQVPVGKSIEAISISGNEYIVNLNEEFIFTMPAEDVNIEILLQNVVYNISYNVQEGLDINLQNSSTYNQKIYIEATNLPENEKLIVVCDDVELDFDVVSNDCISFIMPAQDINLTITSQRTDKHYISIDNKEEVICALDKNEAYFGEEVVLQILKIEEGFVVSDVKVNGVSAQKVNDNEYSFMMPEENVVIEVELFDVPKITFTNNQLQYESQLKQNGTNFYYIITITNLPSDKYVKSYSAFDENGNKLAMSYLQDNRYQVNIGANDLVVSFNLDEKAVTSQGGEDTPDYSIIVLFFVGLVVVVGIVSFAVFKNRD